MKEILLHNSDLFAIVDDDDFERVSKYKWYLRSIGRNNYAVCTATIWPDNAMHRFITNCPWDYVSVVDHKNGNGLDNRRSNLRICTQSQNAANSRRHPNKTGYVGVFFDKRKSVQDGKVWFARLSHLGTIFRVGNFHTKEEAALAYNKKALEIWGEYARLNIVPNVTESSIRSV